VTVVGAGIGEAAIAQSECAGFNVARAVAKIPIREFSVAFVYHWLCTGTAVAWMKGESREVARPTLNLEQLQTIPVPLPPLAEQQEIVSRLDDLFALADQIEPRYATAKQYVGNLKQSILAKAFRGELVPQDPNDEPASFLLERIREARGTKSTSRSQQRVTNSPASSSSAPLHLLHPQR
jgi:type I restriction enzyme S subunit